MRAGTIDAWSRTEGFLQSSHPLAKLACLLVLLIAISFHSAHLVSVALAYVGAAILVSAATRIPVLPFFRRTLLLVPFCFTFALATYVAGNPALAASLLLRSYASGTLAILFIATTPLADLTVALDLVRAPQPLLSTIEFLYRYLFLLTEEARSMRNAAVSRGGLRGRHGFRAAAGALAGLFLRTYSRAAHIHQAMLARGFRGVFPGRKAPVWRWADSLILLFSLTGALLPHVWRSR